MESIVDVKNWVKRSIRHFSRLNRLGTEEKATNTSGKRLSSTELEQLMGMDYERFSQLLPYRYFDEDDQLFINTESIGFALEVAPLSGANEEIIHSIADMIKNKLDHTV